MEPYGDYIYKSYRKACFPGRTDIMVGQTKSWFTNQSFCCNTLECSQRSLSNRVAIGCYVCDSRVTGLAGCSILNASSPHVYKTGSSSFSEVCAVSGLREKFPTLIKKLIFLRRSLAWRERTHSA